MAVQLTEEQRRYFRDLDANFERHVDEYRQQKTEEPSMAARPRPFALELDDHERYLEACRKSEIDDLEINMRFRGAKIVVLREVLATRDSAE